MKSRGLAVLAAALLATAACGESAQDEEATLEEAADEVGAAAEEAGEQIQEAAGEAAQEIDERVDVDLDGDSASRDTTP